MARSSNTLPLHKGFSPKLTSLLNVFKNLEIDRNNYFFDRDKAHSKWKKIKAHHGDPRIRAYARKKFERLESIMFIDNLEQANEELIWNGFYNRVPEVQASNKEADLYFYESEEYQKEELKHWFKLAIEAIVRFRF